MMTKSFITDGNLVYSTKITIYLFQEENNYLANIKFVMKVNISLTHVNAVPLSFFAQLLNDFLRQFFQCQFIHFCASG